VGEDPPLLSAREIPTLVSRRGAFPSSWRPFLARAAAGRIDPADLRREFAAQLERVTGAGIPIGHLDTHQHLHLWPVVGDVVLDLARALGIDAVRRPASAGHGPRGQGVNRLADRLAAAATEAGVSFPDAFAGLDEAGRLDLQAFSTAVRALGARGVGHAEIGCHPGLAEDPERRRYRWGYRWADEFAGLRAPAARQAVESAGFRLGTFAELGRPPGTAGGPAVPSRPPGPATRAPRP
jgi:predicted glycoside hydrolase/deacetylase ChbG (UPF0249 family)